MVKPSLHPMPLRPPPIFPIIGAVKTKPKPKHFIAAWRRHRGMSQDELAAQIGMTSATVSRVEAGKQPYNQKMIEDIASALLTSVADLIAHDPEAPDPLTPVLQYATPDELRQIAALAETVISFRHKPETE
jgi:transcriptional regulator with XRE-family HTH domain